MAPAESIPSANVKRLRDFITEFGRLTDLQPDEPTLVREGSLLLRKLVNADDWLPAPYAEADPKGYRQYLLYADQHSRFSVVSFVWGPGQSTAIHDHTVWGLIGILRGGEREQRYVCREDGILVEKGDSRLLDAGAVEVVSPTLGDIHRVANAYSDRTSISIHVYGADIGSVRRSIYEQSGKRVTFVSGYSNTQPPNLWGRSRGKAGGA